MSNKQEFIEFVDYVIEKYGQEMPENAQKYFNAMKSAPEKEKPMFTDNGKQILKYMKETYKVGEAASAKVIAEGLMMSSRSVSGSIRKLVSDGYIEKVSTDPVLYALTEKGNEINIE